MVVRNQLSIKGALRETLAPSRFSKMNLLSFNCQGVACPLKKHALKRLIEASDPDLIFLLETLHCNDSIIRCLESLTVGWCFAAFDANCCLGGAVVGWRSKYIQVLNIWSVDFDLGIEVISKDLSIPLMLKNIYGPSQNRK